MLAEALSLSSHTRASDLFMAVAYISVSSAHILQNIQRSARVAAWWDGQPPRLHPEFWGNSRTSGTIQSLGQTRKLVIALGAGSPTLAGWTWR